MPRRKKDARRDVLAKAREAKASKSQHETDDREARSTTQPEMVGREDPQPSTASATPAAAVEPPRDYARSRTQQKFTYFEDDKDNDALPVYRIIVDLQQIDLLFKQVICPSCHSSGTLSLQQDPSQRCGLVLRLTLYCSDCNISVADPVYTSQLDMSSENSTRKPFLVNKAATMASLQTGLGPYRFNTLCQHLDMPGIHQKTFEKYAARLFTKNSELADKVFTSAADIIHGAYRQMGYTPDDDGCMDIAVSYDGSWLTRGHKSLIGIGCTIDVLTGLVVDAHVMSQHCQTCLKTGAAKQRESPEEYETWLAEHKASGQCQQNFTGTSGMMEVEGASTLWSRSVTAHNLCYRTFVGDGDSKAFNAVKSAKPYGDKDVTKEECINHVSKRMGTALRNLVSDCSKRGITLGGRGHGKLTLITIRRLCVYYDRAIRSYSTAPEMRKAILASLYHGYSTDDNPQHAYCPDGATSWCFYKKGLATHSFPWGHKKRVHTPLDYDLLHQHLWPVYERLTADALLQRCEKKATQNSNESFHNSVWTKCAKTSFHSKQKVEMAVYTAAAEFNFGPSFMLKLQDHLHIPSGENSVRLAGSRAKKRLNKSLEKHQVAEAKRRKIRREAVDRAQAEAEEEEGAAYAPGMY